MPFTSASPQLATLVANNISRARGASPILVGVDLTVGAEHRIGVVGPNGVGKSTLLKILAGLEPPDGGTVSLSPPVSTVGYLAQEPTSHPGETLRELLWRRTGVGDAERTLAEAAAELASGEPGADDRYSVALDRFVSLGAADLDARVAEVLDEVGLEERLLDVPAASLSGGQKAKAALAALLLSRFDLLLLDEPTNDLDFAGLARLESFLHRRSGGVVVVSHDRAFLEGFVTSVLEIDEHTHEATEYAGGFDAYLEARATARRHAEEAYESYVSERERLRAREREQRQWAVQGVAKEKKSPRDNDKAQRDWRTNRTEKQASKVRITERALERLDAVDRPFQPWQLHLDLATAKRSGDVVARLDGAVVDRGGWRLGPVDLEIAWADRLAVLGANGSGKSTLIGALLGRVPLAEGERAMGPSVVVGELGQVRDRWIEAGRLVDAFQEETGLGLAPARSLLAKFGLGASHVERDAGSLSPGERTRAELALFMAKGANLLVLDEPTNHLDLPAIEQLEQAIGEWPGTLILVTHDRRLLEAVPVNRRIELVDGQVVSNVAA